jgi:hypothetical protein
VRDVSHFVIAVKIDGSYLTQATSDVLNQGEFYFSSDSGKLFVRCLDDADPISKSNWITYRFFFSNIDSFAPSGISSGEIVHYESRIKDIGELKMELDFEQTGIALESNSSLTLHNNDKFFDEIFDTILWENNNANFWSWSKSIPFSEARKIYSGIVSDKSFNTTQVKFTLKDQLTKLKQPLDLGRFTSLDGEIESSILGKPKRVVFGRVDKIRTQGIDKVLDGFTLQGTLTGDSNRNLLTGSAQGLIGQTVVNGLGTNFNTLASGNKIKIIGPLNEYTYEVLSVISPIQISVTSPITATFSGSQVRNLEVENNIVTGIGTDFINQLSNGDVITVIVNSEKYKHTVDIVSSSTQIIVSDEIEVGFYGISAISLPEVSYRKKNREWHIAGHKLREYTTTISLIEDATNIEVIAIGDIQAGDMITVGLNTYSVIRTTGNKVRLNQGLIGVVIVGDSLTKIPVLAVYNGKDRFYINRDYTILNTPTDSVIVLDDLAEFNIAASKYPTVQLSFTSGSPIITSLSTDIDLNDVFKPRDWIRSRSINLQTWYEILSVSQDTIVLRSNVTTTFSGLGHLKSPNYVGDDSLILTDCLGLDDGDWIRYPSQAVKWILSKTGFTDFNNASFDQATDDCEMTLSAYWPQTIGSEFPIIRDMITSINQSCFGSLFMDLDFNFTYSILNSDKPEDLQILKDEDILNFSVTTKNNIINSILLNYAPNVDVDAESETFKTMILKSDFVDEAIGKVERLTQTALLYYPEDATTIAQRWLFFRSLTQTMVTVNAKLNITSSSLNDKVFLDLSRLFKRFGGIDRRKIGIINSISKDSENTSIEFNDLGNLFNRVPSICPDSTNDYIEGESDVAKYGFIVDDLSETADPSSEIGLGTNLIG